MDNKRSSNKRIPQAPPVPQEPTDKMPHSSLACGICARVFKTHSELDRHMEHAHGAPEKTHTKPHGF